MRYNSAEEVLNQLVDAYYHKRDITAVLSCVTDDIKWMGTENNDCASGRKELITLLEEDIRIFPNAFDIEIDPPEEQKLGDIVVMFTLTGKQPMISNAICGYTVRGTVCCVSTEHGWLANNVHISVPNTDFNQSTEQKYIMNNLLNVMPGGVGIFIFAETLRCDYYSDGFAKLAGLSRAEMDDKIKNNEVLSTIIAPVDYPQIGPALAESTAKGLPMNMTYRYVYSDGSIRWLHLTAEKMGERDDYPIYYCVFTTPTEETALYRNITEDSANGVLVAERKSRNILYMNSAAADFCNVSNISEVTGRPVNIILKEHGIKMLLTEAQISSFTDEKYSLHHVERHGKYLSVTGKNLIWNGIEAYILYITDETAEHENQVRQKELFDTIPSGILEFLYDGKVLRAISANHTLMDMMGYEEEEFITKKLWNVSEMVHPEDHYLLREASNSVILGKGLTYDFRLLNKKTGIYRWISCDYTIIARTSEGIRVISAFLDIDDKRKAEDASAAKSRFLSRMSHEIRTPINAIMGIAELEKQDIENNSLSIKNIDKYSKETMVASQYLLTLVNDILDTSKIENNEIEIQQHIVNADEYLADVHTLVESLAKEKKIRFIFERKTRMHEAYIGDGIRVKQIIVNLLNNAFKFTPPGGTVKMVAESIEEGKDEATLRFTISDTGIGMSEEFQKKLFTPFVQENSDTTSPFSGTGLGLSIARSLAQKMGGDITCESEKGKGTTFVVTIVVGIAKDYIAKIKSEDKSKKISHTVNFAGTRILVCEDHPLNQKITKALLERKKCIVEIAADGVIGVDMFEKSSINYYSMIIMDIRMPNMDGLQATQEIRSLNRADARTIPIVAMSANAYDEDIEKSLNAGMNEHLAKPVDAAKLYNAVAQYTQHIISEDDEKKKVLVVDDIKVNRVVIVETLKKEYIVLEAEDGMQALQQLEEYPGIVAVVTDIQMPVMNGFDLIKNIRKGYQYEDLAILVNTQFGDADQEKKLLALGADDFIYKPTSPTMLAIRLKNVLARRKHIL